MGPTDNFPLGPDTPSAGAQRHAQRLVAALNTATHALLDADLANLDDNATPGHLDHASAIALAEALHELSQQLPDVVTALRTAIAPHPATEALHSGHQHSRQLSTCAALALRQLHQRPRHHSVP
ncbi:hypothetical protein DI005_20630 [Prauserella sp. PE36]|uniref:hypothetical protein n=1 Tax=Prauserella sp. PE36 TaxID=1504709 RepID=UPI000DE283D7|nr:hypothetical protein [Prauserella sp. PE36]RBM17938.1 hypothetical protein DI005_20630 [Prauserella sp. PE36]